MRISRARSVLLLMGIAALPSAVPAQPTTRQIVDADPTWSALGAVGAQIAGTVQSGRVLAGTMMARRAYTDAPFGLRLGTLLIRRTYQAPSPSRPGQSFTVKHTVLALTVGGDVFATIGPGSTLGLTAGAGIAPYTATSSSDSSFFAFEPTGRGKVWSLGVTLRSGRFFVEQQLIGLLGSESTIQQFREYYPLLVGWRF